MFLRIKAVLLGLITISLLSNISFALESSPSLLLLKNSFGSVSSEVNKAESLPRVGGRENSEYSKATLKVDTFKRLENVHYGRNILRLERMPISDTNNRTVLEAELAENLKLERGLIGFDKDDNSRFIHYVQRAEYKFRMNKEGNYRVWYRSYFPKKAKWLHREYIDNSNPRKVIDSERNNPVDRWCWVQGPIYNLARARPKTCN
mgnify:CR=1 FL=1